jgi:site-specific DNA-methyltransferase (cytosine-N4-specific)
MSPRDLLVPISAHRQFVPLSVSVNIIIEECLTALQNMNSDTVDCCVTSPPYYFCRDYGDDRQIGLEASPVDFVVQLTNVFREVRRVLKPTGTLWLNIGDNYCTRRAIRIDGKRTVAKGGEMTSWAESSRNGRTISGSQFRNLKIKEKDLFLVPHDLAQALRSDGWYIRGIFHWIKTTIVPERERDGPSDAVEYVFFCTKSDTGYVYNNDVLREQGSDGEGRPHRNVWEIGPSSFRSAHTATMPEELAARCILTGSNEGGLVLDPFGGAGTTAAVAAEYGRNCDLIELNSDYGQIAASRVRSGNINAVCNIIQPVSP